MIKTIPFTTTALLLCGNITKTVTIHVSRNRFLVGFCPRAVCGISVSFLWRYEPGTKPFDLIFVSVSTSRKDGIKCKK